MRIEGARARFTHFFPGHFCDPVYLGDGVNNERPYKLDAAHLLTIIGSFTSGDRAVACTDLVRHFRDDGVATWPCLTLLPFLWAPDRHMFLKPEFTQTYARNVGHRFAHVYDSTPNPVTYEALLDMVDWTRNQISDWSPRDNIDIHSFMFAATEYPG